ncbi:MAG: di-trans,poly-cis-decaprenylcistransferase, partial [Acidobacteriota bacterium]|nr:di-trans,poly-cis-decaprenylcistransferase [Acidobacteriota bacterium]
MSKSTLHLLHAAIIMDGNGRWATSRGLPRIAGHRAGAEAVRRVVEASPEIGIGTLTLYAFSSDNWRRPLSEVSALMGLFERYLGQEAERCRREGVRLSVIGRRDRLSQRLLEAIQKAEALTRSGRTLNLRVAVDYSARDAIVSAAQRVSERAGGIELSRESFSRELNKAINDTAAPSDVDLLIRTGGEQRLSDFLLWECAYAELVFTPRMWPDFDATDLRAAVDRFHERERRFGQVPESRPNGRPVGQLVLTNGEAGDIHHLRGDRW